MSKNLNHVVDIVSVRCSLRRCKADSFRIQLGRPWSTSMTWTPKRVHVHATGSIVESALFRVDVCWCTPGYVLIVHVMLAKRSRDALSCMSP